MTDELAVSRIHIFPVKSLAGIALNSCQVRPRGLQHDRRWMLVDGDGVFVTQRDLPRMALVIPWVGDTALEFRAPAMPRLSVPLIPPPDAAVLTVRVWNRVCTALAVGGEADRWFTAFLGSPCRLVYLPDTPPVSEASVSEAADDGAVTTIGNFADGPPVLLIGEASLRDLNARLADPVPMDRFRPNLVVSGSPAYAEDGWRMVRIGGTIFRLAEPCARCGLTAVDQATGERGGPEPLRTLSAYRRRDQKVLFGVYLIPEGDGIISVGDTLKVLEVEVRKPYILPADNEES